MSEPILLYGLDPGKTTGFVSCSIVDQQLTVHEAFHWGFNQTMDWLSRALKFEWAYNLIVEDYIINPKVHHYDHQGDKGIALRLIGAAQFLAILRPDCNFELQQNFRKPTGYGMLGAHYDRKKQGQHSKDALAHVMYYAVTKKLARPLAESKAVVTPVQKRSSPRIFRAESHSQWHNSDKASSTDTSGKSS